MLYLKEELSNVGLMIIMMVVSVSPIVGLKHPPELAPTVPATVARVMAIASAPSTPSLVEVVIGYFVWRITEMSLFQEDVPERNLITPRL